MKYVIIGNSAAAVGCVEGIRSVDASGKITVIGSEPHHTYSRPLISYLLLGRTDEQRIKYRPDQFYADNNVKALLGVTATAIDPANKRVVLDNGEEERYDRLLIATGSKPFVPPMAGLEDVPNRFTFMDLDSAKALEKALTPESRVLIVGAGLIGLKCAEGIQHSVKSITVVDLADRILPSILDEAGSQMMQRYLEAKGLTFHLSDSVAQFEANNAHLKSGQDVPFDVLVVAVGVRPNVELAKEAGIAANRGIVTDAFCKTTLHHVYAAGDCAESHDITTDSDRILALLPNAYMQGETAGVNMAGGHKLYDKAIPMNAIGFFGLHIVTAGSYDGEEFVEQTDTVYKKLVTKDGLLKGYILIGDIARAGIYTSLIRERTPLDTIDFAMLREKPQLMAFAPAARHAKLAEGPAH